MLFASCILNPASWLCYIIPIFHPVALRPAPLPFLSRFSRLGPFSPSTQFAILILILHPESWILHPPTSDLRPLTSVLWLYVLCPKTASNRVSRSAPSHPPKVFRITSRVSELREGIQAWAISIIKLITKQIKTVIKALCLPTKPPVDRNVAARKKPKGMKPTMLIAISCINDLFNLIRYHGATRISLFSIFIFDGISRWWFPPE